MSTLPRQLEQGGIIASLLELLPASASCWLVGGALRDELLGGAAQDFDFAFDIDPTDVARGIALKIGGTFVELDAARRQSRVVVGRGEGGHRLVLDFAPLRAATLHEDLALRDFTCNALAQDLRKPGTVIDPLGGADDLLKGVLRPCSPGVLADDPLRIVKGIRHAVELNLLPADDFYAEARAQRAGLAATASERIKLELGKIFEHPQVRRSLQMFERAEVWRALCDVGQGTIRVDTAALDHVLHAEAEFSSGERLSGLARSVDERWRLSGLVRLHRSLSRTDPSFRGALFQRLGFSRLGNSLLRLFEKLCDATFPPPGTHLSPRGRGVWLDRFQPSPPAAALYLSSRNRPGFNVMPAVYDDWLACQTGGRVPDLVPARELMPTFGIEPGPTLGKVLELIRAEEISGRISSTFDVAAVVRECMKKD